MELFKPEVYKKMEEKLEGPSEYRGIEQALDMIIADDKLHKFLKDYAVKNRIRKFGNGYRIGNTEIAFEILRIKDKITTSDRTTQVRILLGMDKDCNIMPLIMERKYSHRITQYNGSSYDTSYDVYSKLIRKEEGYIIKSIDETWGRDKDYDNKNIIDAGLFDKVTKEDILNGLEKAINKLLEGGKNE